MTLPAAAGHQTGTEQICSLRAEPKTRPWSVVRRAGLACSGFVSWDAGLNGIAINLVRGEAVGLLQAEQVTGGVHQPFDRPGGANIILDKDRGPPG